jgi:hypothetical protein
MSMKKQGEYLFETFEEAMDFVNNPTNYEKDNGISITGTKILLDEVEFKVVVLEKSDSTKTLFIFFRNGKKFDVWKFWCPSEEQALLLGAVYPLYQAIDLRNSKKRNGGIDVGTCACGKPTKGDFTKCYDCFQKDKQQQGQQAPAPKPAELSKDTKMICMGLAIKMATKIACSTIESQGKTWEDTKVAYDHLIMELFEKYKSLYSKVV